MSHAFLANPQPPAPMSPSSTLSTRTKPALKAMLFALVFLGLAQPLFAQSEQRGDLSKWERSIVTLEITRKQYDYYQPWTKRPMRLSKMGTVIGEREILTTADQLSDCTMVRLQKGGRGQWWIGQVAWVDYHANLALITTSEPEFWRGLEPPPFGGTVPADGMLQILRWREGNLESRRAEFTQFSVREGQLSPVNQVVLEASSEIQSAGWAEPMVANAHVVGIVWAQDNRTCITAPASAILSILEARKKGQYKGLGFFHFFWQPAENPASLRLLQLTGEPRGVIVIQVPDRPDHGKQVLKPKDIILQIDGFDLDIQGDYQDPEFGHLMLERLATRNKWAGDDVKMSIWREGKPMEVTYCLPKLEVSNALVPFGSFDQEPEYLILGGLVFQPLTDAYLQSWGAEWKRRSPFRLFYYRNEPPTRERPALVLLSQVLPDPYNIGYQGLKYLVLDKVNGQRISRLADLREALQKPTNGYHIVDCVRSDSVRRIVLAAGETEQQATGRVLKRYGIGESSRLAKESK